MSIIEVSKEEFEALEREIDREKARRARRMPTEQAALNIMFETYTRLKELGWRDAIYCPKDGNWFDSISAGSTGIHLCQYQGEWPKGSWWVSDGGDLWPAHPILWRPTPQHGASHEP